MELKKITKCYHYNIFFIRVGRIFMANKIIQQKILILKNWEDRYVDQLNFTSSEPFLSVFF